MNKVGIGAALLGALAAVMTPAASQAESLGPANGSPCPLTNENRACFGLVGSDGYVQNNCPFTVAWDVVVPRKFGNSACSTTDLSACLSTTNVSALTTGTPGDTGTTYKTGLYGYDHLGRLSFVSKKTLTQAGLFLKHTVTIVGGGTLIMEHEVPHNGKVGSTIY